MTPMIPPEEEAGAMPVVRQEPRRYHLRAMTLGLTVRPALGDGISDALSCKFSRDSTGSRRTAHIHVRDALQDDPPWSQSWLGRRYTATSRGLHGATLTELARDRIVVGQLRRQHGEIRHTALRLKTVAPTR